ncbi:MAG: metallophosphoesterase [Paludibacteraceae bacterium]|nr:metallophosphoesterase [Paludibacteraceae bacterium]
MRKSSYLFLLPFFLLTSCADPDTTDLDVAGLFSGQSERTNVRFTQSMAYNDSVGYPVIAASDETYRVFVCTDTHISDCRDNLEYFISAYRQALDCPLALHLGDHIDAQTHWDFMDAAFTDIPANPLKHDTCLHLVGNHDLYFGQWTTYRSLYRTGTYYAVVQTPSGAQDLFIVLDSGEGSLGSLQLAWLRQLLDWADNQPFRHRIVCTHTHLFKPDASQGHTSNFELEETYELMSLFTRHQIELFLSGHDHSREVYNLNGVTYIVLDALEQKGNPAFYLELTLAPVASSSVSSSLAYSFVSVPDSVSSH